MNAPVLTDSGLETWLVFLRGTDLPDFASFPLLDDPKGRALLTEYYRDHLRVASEVGSGLVLETPTWRANPDHGAPLGYDAAGLDRVNRTAVGFVRDIATGYPDVAVTVSGNLGPRGDGYDPGVPFDPSDAAAYHRPQIASFAGAGADRVTIVTVNQVGEGIGVVLAAADVGIPVVVSFTVETDGRLPTGQPLLEAIEQVDAATGGAALYFGVNCAHPDHFGDAMTPGASGTRRIGMLRANASRASHAELDAAEVLDDGDPVELAAQYAALLDLHPDLVALGGCCGTDTRHIQAIAQACILPS